MISNDDVVRGLSALADHLRARRANILEAWRRATRNDPVITTATTLSSAQFYDHIPKLLDALERTLRVVRFDKTLGAHTDEIVEGAESHGLQRWQQGYADREVMREWIALNTCLADEMDRFTQAHPQIPPEAISQGWRCVAEVTIEGMGESIAQYTELAKAEAAERVTALRQALAQLADLEKQRAEAWRQAAHDLRGNVDQVQNVAAIIEKAGPSEKFLRMLGRSVSSLQVLLNDLTTEARLDAGHETRKVRTFDAAVALSQLAARMQLTATERGLVLITEGADSLVVDGDEVKVCRIAQNLLLNAIKYTPRGSVRLAWEVAAGDAPRWCLSIQDTGPGLAAEALRPLAAALEAATRDAGSADVDAASGDDLDQHSAFSTSPSASDGSRSPRGEGVGLAIVKRLCELLDARLELHTAPGEGTLFRVTLPREYWKG